MSTAEPRTELRPISSWLQRVEAFGPILPLAALFSTLPYTVVYFVNLWQQPHYQFFPLLLVVVALLLRRRVGGYFRGPIWWRLFSGLLLAAGVFAATCATAFASPWMGYCAFACSAASWLAAREDRETGRSLFHLALPLALVWQPPYNTIITGDTVLIQKLQTVSARFSSQWLDILGYPHFQPGTILEFAGRSFGVAEACSGVQSFFALLCFASLLVAYFRRGPFHAAILLGTSPIWAVLMNTARITAIPIAHAAFGMDLAHGVLHDLLGYCTMGIALGLLLSTDELLLKLSDVISFGSWKFPSTPSQGTFTRPKLSRWAWISLSPALLVLFGFFAIEMIDVKDSWGSQRKVIDFFRDEPLVQMAPNAAPEELAGWKQTDYQMENRERSNDDLGQRSDVWYYRAPFGQVTVGFDQMFPGWHELTRCYRSAGWKLENRRVIESSASGTWPIVEAEFTRGNEHGYLLWSLKTRDGKIVDPPGQWNTWTSLQERLQNRLTPSVRGALFGIACYQMQIFSTTSVPLSETERSEMMSRYLPVREQLWQAAEQWMDRSGMR